MCTKLVLTLTVCCLFGMMAQAQNFNAPKINVGKKVYSVKKIKGTVFLSGEHPQFDGKPMGYRIDTLNLSGLLWKKAQIEVTEKIKKYLINDRRISIESLPNVGTEWFVLKTGEIKEVTFIFPQTVSLTAQDFETMEKIITQTKIDVTKPHLYKSVNYIPLFIPFRWNSPVR